MLSNSSPDVTCYYHYKKKEISELVTKLVEIASSQTEVTSDDIVASSKDLVNCQNCIKDLSIAYSWKPNSENYSTSLF